MVWRSITRTIRTTRIEDVVAAAEAVVDEVVEDADKAAEADAVVMVKAVADGQGRGGGGRTD